MVDKNKIDKISVLEANKKIHELGLVFQSFGNVSGLYGDTCLIKPSGVDLNKLNELEIVAVNIKTNKIKEGNLKPSSDTPTHIALYQEFSEIGGIVHTHSLYATSWAQSAKEVPCLGTTHADYWNGPVPITRHLSKEEIIKDYEKNTGKVIIEKLKELSLSPIDCPGILVPSHGPFAWGKDVNEAVKHAQLLEYVAKQAFLTLSINPSAKKISKVLLGKHYNRKHGPNSYYGQNS